MSEETVVKRRKTARRSSAAPTVAPSPGHGTIAMGPGLDIKDVEDGHQKLMAALAAHQSLTVDLNRVSTIDTAGIQLLLALRNEAAKRRITLDFIGDSAPFRHALTVLGLRDPMQFAVDHA